MTLSLHVSFPLFYSSYHRNIQLKMLPFPEFFFFLRILLPRRLLPAPTTLNSPIQLIILNHKLLVILHSKKSWFIVALRVSQIIQDMMVDWYLIFLQSFYFWKFTTTAAYNIARLGGGVKTKYMRGGTSSKAELLSELCPTKEKYKSLNAENK